MVSLPKDFYTAKIGIYNGLIAKSTRLSKIISQLRLIVFVLTLASIIFFAQNGSYSMIFISLLVGVTAFAILIRHHSKVLAEKKYREALLKINQEELKALDGDFSCFDDGKKFVDAGHNFGYDLDIFGEGSLFQFLNRTCTNSGRDVLAERLKQPFLQLETIKVNQVAIKELKNKIEWRQDFQAAGMTIEDKVSDKERILKWVQLPALFSHRIFKVLIIIVPVLTVMMGILEALGFISGMQLLLYLSIPYGITGVYLNRINRRHHYVSKTAEMLAKYALLIKKIEALPASSPLILKLKSKVLNEQFSASKQLKLLSSIVTALDTRLNMLVGVILNGLLLWDIIQMRRLEKWQRLNRKHLSEWFESIAEIDAMISFSNYFYNDPDLCLPDLTQNEFEINGEEVGHPLIQREARVNNPVEIKQGQFLIVTGANMAGKSTYLRTVGVNMVLAMCGAPVCARSFRFKPVNIFTSIHTSDSLARNESYFYSELKRLKLMIAELEKGTELFIILDEILRGTNSKDKHAGSEALLKQLIRFGTNGIVATHDVDLGSLQEIFPENICNRCFEAGIDGNRLSFSYKLREGVPKNMNATILMREMGITV
jgi:hypothetical protein